MAQAYTDILSTRRDSIKEPQPLPLGTYVAVVKNIPKIDKGGKNNNDFAEVEFSIIAAQGDVNPDELAAAGGLPKDLKHTFWLTSKSLFIVERFLQAVGITVDEAPTVAEGLTLIAGRSVQATVVLGRKNAKTGKQYPEISEFAAA